MSKKWILGTSSIIVVPLLVFASGCGGADDTVAPATTGGSAGSGPSTSGSGGTAGSGGAATTAGGGGSSSGGAAGEGGSTGSGGSGGSAGSGGSGGAGPDAGDSADAQPDGRSCGPSGPLDRPTAPAAVDAPPSATLAARFHAYGVQIYTCTAGNADAGADAAASYSWILKAPEATLEDATCAPLGTHFAGPTWQSSDGSSVVGSRLTSAPSSNSNSIAQLLLQAIRNSGEGVFANVTFIQRLDTKDGNPPPDGCTAATVGAETRSYYTATYYFYIGGATPDGGADASTSDSPGE